jgi:hypothetical protein
MGGFLMEKLCGVISPCSTDPMGIEWSNFHGWVRSMLCFSLVCVPAAKVKLSCRFAEKFTALPLNGSLCEHSSYGRIFDLTQLLLATLE